MSHNRRADARANHDRIILAAAYALLSERGLNIGMREIARRAQVGPATLYRHFPTKQLLVEEVWAGQIRRCRQIVRDGSSDPDPARGFTCAMTHLISLNAAHRGFVDAYMAATPPNDVFRDHRLALLADLWRLTLRAQATGHVRKDLTRDDIVLVLLASRGLAALNVSTAERGAERFAQLAIDALRA
ncbi:UNVERIFIED_ORG: TetR family transcriptional regulator [Gordonia westfalica J30]